VRVLGVIAIVVIFTLLFVTVDDDDE